MWYLGFPYVVVPLLIRIYLVSNRVACHFYKKEGLLLVRALEEYILTEIKYSKKYK